MLKKSAFVSASNSIYCCNACTANPRCSSKTSPSVLPIPRARPGTRQSKSSQWRSYATVRDRTGPDFRDNMNWPCRKVKPSTPTPYEIFELETGAAYSKHKFYELVKMYHPDRTNQSLCASLSHVERLERYRLVVQAHEILSDPIKRKAYDSYGAGWGERGSTSRHSRGFANGHGREYGYGPENDASVFGNATWEDWERWYRRHEGPHMKQAYAGTYVNPNAFASFVILMAVLTGVIQATRAGQYSTSLGEKAQAFTEETTQFMSARAQNIQQDTGRSADGRIKHFLERRDPSRYGLKDEEEETYRKHFIADQKGLVPSKEASKREAE